MLFALGHGTLPISEFLALLARNGVQRVVDVRKYPASRRHPQFEREALAASLESAGVLYRWEPELGGRRNAVEKPSPDVALRNLAFRNYAGYMRTPGFLEAVNRLLDEAGRTQTAILCSETLWWKCHRRLIANYVTLVRNVPVEHVMHSSRRTLHPPTGGVRAANGALLYDVPDGQPPLPMSAG